MKHTEAVPPTIGIKISESKKSEINRTFTKIIGLHSVNFDTLTNKCNHWKVNDNKQTYDYSDFVITKRYWNFRYCVNLINNK